MDRRHALTLLAVSASASTLAFAKDAMSDADIEHATETLAVGTVALQTAEMAEQKAENPWVKKFARYEAAEQTTIAGILKSMGFEIPQLDAKHKTIIAQARDAQTGAAFDQAFLANQLDGHRQLLQIQETYIAKGKNDAGVNLAKLAAAQISEHIDLIQTIGKAMKG